MINIKTGKVEEFEQDREGCLTICFGAGAHFDNIMTRLIESEIYKVVDYIVDNDISLSGSIRQFREKTYPIISYNKLCQIAETNNIIILVTNYKYINEIVKQMDDEDSLNGITVYIGDLLVIPLVKYQDFQIPVRKSKKIPEVIHYCWFGRNPFPQEYKRYIETWKNLCPRYTIQIWTEDNYDISKNKFMREAYDNKIWAFVSDYARVDIIHQYGGIYLDCDVELLKPLDDMLGNELYCGFEDYKYINLGLGYGAVKGHPYLDALLDYYNTVDLFDNDGEINLTACPYHQTEVAKAFGLIPENRFQELERMTVFPSEVFAPYSYWGLGETTEKTYSIHHFSASWHDEKDRSEFNAWKERLGVLYQRIQRQPEMKI